MSRVVVSNVQVLTAGTRYDQEKSKDGKPIPSTVVTLLRDAGRRRADRRSRRTPGSIMLVLRNPLDVVPTETTGVRIASLMGAPDAPPAVKVQNGRARVVARKPSRSRRRRPPKLYIVEAIRAAKRSEEVVKWNEGPRHEIEPWIRRTVSSRRWRAPLLFAAAGVASHAQAPVRGPAGAGAAGRSPARSASGTGTPSEYPKVSLTAGRSTVLTTDFDITRIAVTNPAVADATVVRRARF